MDGSTDYYLMVRLVRLPQTLPKLTNASPIRRMVSRISASVVFFPMLSRMLLCISSSLSPMAFKTWLGVGSAEVQALPMLKAMSLSW